MGRSDLDVSANIGVISDVFDATSTIVFVMFFFKLKFSIIAAISPDYLK